MVTLVTQTVVDADDPAFADPTKFVGSVYDRAGGQGAGRAEHDWTFTRTERAGAASSPHPLPARIVEIGTADLLLRSGITVVLAGGGGVPVVEVEHGLEGVEAVVDKDLAAALVARRSWTPTCSLVLTDVTAVMTDFGTADQRALGEVSVSDLECSTSRPAPWDPRWRRCVSSCDEPARVPRSVPSTTRWPSAPARQEPRSGPVRRHDAAKMRSALGTPRPETPKLSSRRPRLSSTVTVI